MCWKERPFQEPSSRNRFCQPAHSGHGCSCPRPPHYRGEPQNPNLDSTFPYHQDDDSFLGKAAPGGGRPPGQHGQGLLRNWASAVGGRQLCHHPAADNRAEEYTSNRRALQTLGGQSPGGGEQTSVHHFCPHPLMLSQSAFPLPCESHCLGVQ